MGDLVDQHPVKALTPAVQWASCSVLQPIWVGAAQ